MENTHQLSTYITFGTALIGLIANPKHFCNVPEVWSFVCSAIQRGFIWRKDTMKVQYNLRIMPQFFGNLLRALRERRGTDMSFMCRHLLSERGEASQTALAQEIIIAYKAMNDEQRLKFFEMLSRDFEPDRATIVRAAADYQSAPGPKTLAALSAAVESPRQEL